MTDQRTNPLMGRPRTDKGPVTVEKIQELAERLNRTEFAHAYGWKYFVGSKQVDGTERATLDRRDVVWPTHEQAKWVMQEHGLTSRFPSNRNS